jgi:peptidoglycan/LPS O-acetylase OafA/YrhL
MPNAERANNFDLIRLFAASQVIFIHSNGWLTLPRPDALWAAVYAFPGVPIFFVISGFLVTRSFIDGERQIGPFFWRRALRIYPGLWVHFLVIMTMLWVGGAISTADFSTMKFWKWLGAAFVVGNDFWANIVAGNLSDYAGFYKWFPSGVLWTMTAELGFYLLTPIIFGRYLERRGLVPIAIAVAFAASIVASGLLGEWQRAFPNFNTTGYLSSGPAPFFWIFLIGAAASYWWASISGFFVDMAARWAIFYAIFCLSEGLIIGLPQIDPMLVNQMTVVNLFVLAGLVISCAYTAPRAARSLHGIDVSYGLYLYHMPFIATLKYAGIVAHWWLWPIVYLVPFCVALLSWFGIERPALRLKQRLRRAPITAADLSDNRWPRSSALPTAQK